MAIRKSIVMVGAGAVGGFVGGSLAEAGHDVTLIDFWHEHVEAIRKRGLEITGMEEGTPRVLKAETLNLSEVSSLAKRRPVDIAFISMKSYDTEWATRLIRPYLAPNGFVVSLQNCINEEAIAGVVGWGKTVGCIVSRISVGLYEPGRIRRTAEKAKPGHTVFKFGEVHGGSTPRVELLADMFNAIDSAAVTTNLWGERWSKLSHNSMRSPIAAATGLTSKQIDADETLRHFALRIGCEAALVGRANGFRFKDIGGIETDLFLRAASDAAAFAEIDRMTVEKAQRDTRSDLARPSMAQDMAKGRKTEIGQMNGFIVEKAQVSGLAVPMNALVLDMVNRVERGERKANPGIFSGLIG